MTKVTREESIYSGLQFPSIESVMVERGTAENSHFSIHNCETEKEHWVPFETSEPCGASPLLRPHPLILPKLFHQPWNKYSK